MPVASVSSRHQVEMITRIGRGFSIGEVSEAEVPMVLARSWNLMLDVRRRSVLEPNVASLKSWFSTAKEIKIKAPEPEAVAEEKPKARKRPTQKKTTKIEKVEEAGKE
jgi:hypothetical protein